VSKSSGDGSTANGSALSFGIASGGDENDFMAARFGGCGNRCGGGGGCNGGCGCATSGRNLAGTGGRSDSTTVTKRSFALGGGSPSRPGRLWGLVGTLASITNMIALWPSPVLGMLCSQTMPARMVCCGKAIADFPSLSGAR
jgi:hypothetical protein